MSVRDDLVNVIEAAVGDTVHVIPYQDNYDLPDRVTVMVKQVSLQPLAEAPRGSYRVNYTLTVISPALDPSTAESELDDIVPSLLGDLDGLDWFAWATAEKVPTPSGGLGYDIACYIVARKTSTTTREEQAHA